MGAPVYGPGESPDHSRFLFFPGDGFGFVVIGGEEVVESNEPEEFLDFGAYAADRQFFPAGGQFLIQGNHDTQGSGGDAGDAGEIQDQGLAVEVFGKVKETFGGIFDIFIIQNRRFGETENSDPFYPLDFKFPVFRHIHRHRAFLFDYYTPPNIFKDTIFGVGCNLKRQYSISSTYGEENRKCKSKK
jgi:hypothetical protein